MRVLRKLFIAAALAAALLMALHLDAAEAPIPKSELRNGSAFTSAANRASALSAWLSFEPSLKSICFSSPAGSPPRTLT